jgi:hypothetical protein
MIGVATIQHQGCGQLLSHRASTPLSLTWNTQVWGQAERS